MAASLPETRLCGEGAVDAPGAVLPLVDEVHPRDVRGGVQASVQGAAGEVAVDRGGHAAQLGETAPEVAPQPPRQVVGGGFEFGFAADPGAVHPGGHLASGHRLQQPDRPAVAHLPGDLGGPDDGGRGGCVREDRVRRHRPLRPPADAARVHDRRGTPGTAPWSAARELEDLPALHEEGAPLVEAGLERGEVDHGRVHLDLAEVGVDGGVEGEVRAQPVLEVRARPSEVVRTGAERVAERHVGGRRLANVLGAQPGVGQDLQPAPGSDALDSAEVSEARHAAGFQLGREGEDGALLVAVDGALDLEPPLLIRVGAEAQLAEGDAHLHEPSFVRDRGGDVPDRVPGTVPPAVTSPSPEDAGAAAQDFVALHPRGIGGEAIRGAVIVVAVHGHREEIRIGHACVPAGEPGGDRGGVQQPRAHVERVVVVEESDFGALADGEALVRVHLGELRHGRGVVPRRLLESAIDADVCGRADCACFRRLGVRHYGQRWDAAVVVLLGREGRGGGEECGGGDQQEGRQRPGRAHGTPPPQTRPGRAVHHLCGRLGLAGRRCFTRRPDGAGISMPASSKSSR